MCILIVPANAKSTTGITRSTGVSCLDALLSADWIVAYEIALNWLVFIECVEFGIFNWIEIKYQNSHTFSHFNYWNVDINGRKWRSCLPVFLCGIGCPSGMTFAVDSTAIKTKAINTANNLKFILNLVCLVSAPIDNWWLSDTSCHVFCAFYRFNRSLAIVFCYLMAIK